MRGLGVEAAKNLILAGPHRVDIYDPTTAKMGDLGANFYLTEHHVGNTSRAAASVGKLRELNPYVKVDVVHESISEDTCKDYDLVIVTELFHTIEEFWILNEALRAERKGFILSQTLGVYGYTFVDFGDDFIIYDEDGEEPQEYYVNHIENAEEPIVSLVDCEKLKFSNSTFVKFKNVEGMIEINNIDLFPITIIDKNHFKLKLNTSTYNEYWRYGTVEEVKVPKKQKFNSLREALVKPFASSPDQCFITPDLGLFDRPGVLHIALQGVLRFHQNNGRLPSNTEEDAQACLDYSKSINDELKGTEGAWTIDEFDATIFNNVSRYASASISPVAAFFGGVVAQEVVKFTGKYTPITQWLHLDFFKSLPKGEVTRTTNNSRYDDQTMVFGTEIQEKLHKQRLFLVGAGALGCEFIKQFALMGIGWSKDGLISCTDNDNIEVLNLMIQIKNLNSTR